MEAEFLPTEDHQAVLEITSQLGDCRTQEELHQLLKISLVPLMDCNGAFYTCLEGDCNTPRLLDAMSQSSLCQCQRENVLRFATQYHWVDSLPANGKVQSLITEAFCNIGRTYRDRSMDLCECEIENLK